MLRKSLVLLSLLVFLPFCVAAEEFKAVGLVLGESAQATIEQFKGKGISLVRKEADSLVYETPLVNIKYGGETELEFYQNKLMRIRVYFNMPNERFQDFKKHYAAFKGALERKYGRPISRRELIPRSFNGNLSASMLEGEIGYGSIFQSGDVEIRFMLKNKDRRTYRYFLQYEDVVMKKNKLEESEVNLDVL